jgi:ABC-type multidrug transport system ATPase subunit
LEIKSDIRLNNYAVDPTNMGVRKNIAFVAQDDSLLPTQTPREAIYFSAKLRLPESTSEAHLQMLTGIMLEELGLTHCADTIVGGPLLKGISGGERKRCSVGVELVTRPAMVFLDEPTSGLDSFSAVQLCKVLKKVADSGASVLFTIHQPSSEIFNAFDRLILMNRGRIMWQGQTFKMNGFFKKHGHKIPKGYNPADWIMNVAQAFPISKLEEEGFFPSDKRRLPAPCTHPVEEGKDALGITIRKPASLLGSNIEDTPPGMKSQIKMLFVRELNNMKRDKSILGGRFAFTAFLGLLIGVIFLDVGESDSSYNANLNSHFGAVIMVLMMGMMGTAQQALLVFPQERPVFLREYSTNHYSVISYFVNRLAVEVVVTGLQILVLILITFWLIGFQSQFGLFYVNVYGLAMASTAISVALGCAVEDPKLGQEMLPILFIPQLMFAGFFVAPDLIPAWLRWLQYVFPLTYSVRLSLIYEFEDCGGGQADINCANLLDNVNADPEQSWWYWMVIIVIFVVMRTLGLFMLRKKATKFL